VFHDEVNLPSLSASAFIRRDNLHHLISTFLNLQVQCNIEVEPQRTMAATTPSRDVLMGTEATNSLPSELLEKQLEALERFQKLLVTVHTQYTTVLVDIMQATNGEIIEYLPILPSVVKERTKDLLQMDFRSQGYTIFCGFEHTRCLITDAIETTQRLLQGFYNISEGVLAEKDKGVSWTRNYDARLLQKIMQSRQENQEQLAKVERDIAVLEGEVVLLRVEFDMMVNSYWNSKAADEPNRQEVRILTLQGY